MTAPGSPLAGGAAGVLLATAALAAATLFAGALAGCGGAPSPTVSYSSRAAAALAQVRAPSGFAGTGHCGAFGEAAWTVCFAGSRAVAPEPSSFIALVREAGLVPLRGTLACSGGPRRSRRRPRRQACEGEARHGRSLLVVALTARALARAQSAARARAAPLSELDVYYSGTIR